MSNVFTESILIIPADRTFPWGDLILSALLVLGLGGLVVMTILATKDRDRAAIAYAVMVGIFLGCAAYVVPPSVARITLYATTPQPSVEERLTSALEQNLRLTSVSVYTDNDRVIRFTGTSPYGVAVAGHLTKGSWGFDLPGRDAYNVYADRPPLST